MVIRPVPVLLASTLGLGAALAVPRPASACDLTGTVVDADDRPVEGMSVRLADGTASRHTVTDAEGRFGFAGVTEPADVTALLTEGGPAPRFVLVEHGEPVGLTVALDPSTRCEVTLGPESSNPLAPDLLALYQGLRRGFALMDQLELRADAPLRVEVDDPLASPTAAYWVGTSSFSADDPLPARLVLGALATRRDDPGAPDNREYHELGHHALATAFGALPRARDDAPQNDYHHNPSSSHAWTEGFAIFFAAMVAERIEHRPDAGRYRVEGAWLDLELDYQPWDLRGTESIAVASLLWDLVDGAREGEPSVLEVVDPQLLIDTGVPYLLVGQVHNPGDARVTDARVRVSSGDFVATAPVGPGPLSPGGEGWFALPVPEAVALGDDPLDRLRLEASTRFATADDDPVQVELSALMTAITQFRSDRADGNGRLFDVAELYQAVRGRFGGKDADGDGRDDIEQLFVAHGLFADVDGDRRHDPGEAVGLTSHPGRTVQVDGTPQDWPALVPRQRLIVLPALHMKVKVEPAEATVLVVVGGSAWGGYLVPTGASELVLIPPPAGQGHLVSVVALGGDRRPTVMWSADATALLAELETHDAPHLAVGATLPSASRATTVDDPVGWPRLAFGGGALAALAGLVLMAIGWPRLR